MGTGPRGSPQDRTTGKPPSFLLSSQLCADFPVAGEKGCRLAASLNRAGLPKFPFLVTMEEDGSS